MWLMTMKMYESDVVPHSILLLQLPLLVEACIWERSEEHWFIIRQPAQCLCVYYLKFFHFHIVYSSYISFDENLLGLDNKLQPYTFQTHAG